MFTIDDVMYFINQFKKIHPSEIEDVFSNGYCYYFATILNERFYQGGTIMYIPIYNHFCYSIYGKLYDIKGEIKDPEMIKLAEPWDSYKKQDELEAKRIFRDCILKISS